MHSLLRFLSRYKHVLVFLLLLAIGLYLLYGYNTYQRAQAGYALKQYEAAIEAKFRVISDYIGLVETNERLADENFQLRNELAKRYMQRRSDSVQQMRDTVYNRWGEYISARIVSNSIAKQHNFFIIEGGELNGITPQMPVYSNGAVAGIVVATSKRYAEVVSLLNPDLNISALLPKSGDAGSVSWDGKNYTTALLHDIPHHVSPLPGDSVVTSGYSNIFPYGMLIGFVEKVETTGADFNTIRIRLATNFNRMRYVTVFNKAFRQEIDSLISVSESNGR